MCLVWGNNCFVFRAVLWCCLLHLPPLLNKHRSLDPRNQSSWQNNCITDWYACYKGISCLSGPSVETGLWGPHKTGFWVLNQDIDWTGIGYLKLWGNRLIRSELSHTAGIQSAWLSNVGNCSEKAEQGSIDQDGFGRYTELRRHNKLYYCIVHDGMGGQWGQII